MRFSFIAITVLASISTVSALGELAFNLGVKKNDGSCKQTDDYLADFKIMSGYSNVVKFYASSDCNTLQIMGPAAQSSGFSMWVGVWPTDEQHFEAEKAALIAYLPTIKRDYVEGFMVGSESLYRKDLTATQLAEKINTIRTLISGIKDSDGNSYAGKPVGTVDSWNVLIEGSSLPAITAGDAIMANAYSFWQGQTIANSSHSFMDDIMQVLQVIQTAKGSTDVNFWVGETGWPTAGSDFGDAHPSIENARDFWKNGVCGIRAWGVNVCFFEAFDEDWKPDTSHSLGVEKHWGAWYSNRTLKYPLTCDFGNQA